LERIPTSDGAGVRRTGGPSRICLWKRRFLEAFLAAFEEATGRSASAFSACTYSAAHWIGDGMKGVGGDVEDRDRLPAPLKKGSLQGDPRGPIRIDQYGSPIQNIYIRKVERVGGRLQNTVIYIYPNVG
jgi:branched-chain amino acid transport system substrate-binding protein